MGCLRLDILDRQYYNRTVLWEEIFARSNSSIGAASNNMSERERANTFVLKMSERSGDHIFSKHFSFASFSFVATKENEEGSINMNGRLYDQLLGRMLSPDPFVQAPTFTQSFNRYSYVWNNPLRYTDPSGYLTWCHISRSFCPGYQSQFFSMMEMQQALLATDGGGGGFSFWTGQGFIGGVPGAPRLGTPGGVVAFQAANRIPAIGTPDMIINGQRFYHTPLGDRAVSSYFFGRMSGTMDTEVTLRGVAVVFPNARDPRGGYNIFARGHLPGGANNVIIPLAPPFGGGKVGSVMRTAEFILSGTNLVQQQRNTGTVNPINATSFGISVVGGFARTLSRYGLGGKTALTLGRIAPHAGWGLASLSVMGMIYTSMNDMRFAPHSICRITGMPVDMTSVWYEPGFGWITDCPFW